MLLCFIIIFVYLAILTAINIFAWRKLKKRMKEELYYFAELQRAHMMLDDKLGYHLRKYHNKEN